MRGRSRWPACCGPAVTCSSTRVTRPQSCGRGTWTSRVSARTAATSAALRLRRRQLPGERGCHVAMDARASRHGSRQGRIGDPAPRGVRGTVLAYGRHRRSRFPRPPSELVRLAGFLPRGVISRESARLHQRILIGRSAHPTNGGDVISLHMPLLNAGKITMGGALHVGPGTHHPCRRPVWADQAAVLTDLITNPRTPRGEQARLRLEHERTSQVLATIDAANPVQPTESPCP